jgi:hypothetical protein
MTLIITQWLRTDGSPSGRFEVLAQQDGLGSYTDNASSYGDALGLAIRYLEGLRGECSTDSRSARSSSVAPSASESTS